jgi:hypothetical protein
VGRALEARGIAGKGRHVGSGDRRRHGVFRDLVSARTAYVGADLEPLDPATIPLDIDRDELPERTFDYAVLLGVITYLHRPREAARKICGVADRNRRLVLLQARGAGGGGRSREPR